MCKIDKKRGFSGEFRVKTGIIVSHLGIKVSVEFHNHERSMIRVARNSGHVVGDRVVVDNEKLTRLDRDNYLIRHTRFGDQIMAANLNAVGIVVSTIPKIPHTFIDRAVVATRSQNIQPIIILNKSDLPESTQLYDDLILTYGSSLQIFSVSARRQEGLDHLRVALNNIGRSALIGVSGVGKSSLMNVLLPDAKLTTSDDIDQREHGKHITTVSNLLHLPSGGELIDTPGIRDFEPVDLDVKELAQYFVGFEKALQRPCQFRNCLHIKEPGCSIRDAVKNGDIRAERYETYLELVKPK